MDTNQLCKIGCGFFGRETLGNFIPHKPLYNPEWTCQKEQYETLASWEMAACNGCPVCILLLRQFEIKLEKMDTRSNQMKFKRTKTLAVTILLEFHEE
jgi:hypothetical protein